MNASQYWLALFRGRHFNEIKGGGVVCVCMYVYVVTLYVGEGRSGVFAFEFVHPFKRELCLDVFCLRNACDCGVYNLLGGIFLFWYPLK